MNEDNNELVTGKNYCINFQDVSKAADRINGIAHRTPVLTSTSLNEICSNKDSMERCDGTFLGCGRHLFFKIEAMQRTGSFKFRGALNATLSLLENSDKQTRKGSQGNVINVVTHSSGNHAAALALSAKLASKLDTNYTVNATIVMPKNAPDIKKAGVKGFGGEIILVDNTNEAREDMADLIVEERNAFFVHPSEDVRVIAGQGTASLELVEQVREILSTNMLSEKGMVAEYGERRVKFPLDAVIIPVGGGGLASGNTIALRGLLADNVKIILAEPSEMDDAKRSKQEGKLLGHHKDNELNSVADGLKTTLGPNTWPIVRDLVDDIITVSEEEILFATKLIWERLKVCIEPSAGVGVAVAMSEEFLNKYKLEDGIENIGVILCGGNVDVVNISKLMQQQTNI